MALIDRFLERLIKRGTLTLVRADGSTRTFGQADVAFPSVTMRFADASIGRDIVLNPRLGLAEAYMDGRVTVDDDDIMGLISLARSNAAWEKAGSLDGGGRLRGGFRKIFRTLAQLNARAASKKNVAHHYDLSGALYDLFLDKDRQYSCAYWDGDHDDLDRAQEDKKAHIAAKLALKPGMKVLDIGCGWGGMALYLHRRCGVDVTGITLSEEQLGVARRRAEEAGVAEHVRFELIDYRDMKGSFDRIVSVGMFEHVGAPNFREFFRCCHNLLTPEGVMLLHTIGRMGGPGATDAFTRKYIFPGGYIPALSEIVQASEPNRLMVTDVESLRLHYGRTCRAWYERCRASRSQIEALYDARFYRMWTFYLAGAATVFEHGGMLIYQLQYARDRRTLPITRDYMVAAEAQLRAPA
ncbi:cyclopropane-fatty-acyl-phospholipid synthase [Sphingobium sp. DEHP117]|uniref:class I SAM-dependent methyltransferase n=1 Tax=Sphingobium sp. DEHP117 TaxID=2993436 RepID=UPI0027D5E809|nr:class I SAM-dependent methyltransferase [Sphingobium sp. DEHP117]MDQ4419023.1 cyclopropane-fatty-acyl-phospholipid synthase [Sphingobium sp. DEHP117]